LTPTPPRPANLLLRSGLDILMGSVLPRGCLRTRRLIAFSLREEVAPLVVLQKA
jgi:hypothetical protein